MKRNTLRHDIDQFLMQYVGYGKSKNTVRSYRPKLRTFREFLKERYSLDYTDQLRGKHYDAYLYHLEMRYQNGDFSAATQNAYVYALHAFLNRYAAEIMPKKDPMMGNGLKYSKKSSDSKIDKALSDQALDILAIQIICGNSRHRVRNYAFVQTLRFTGQRPHAIRTLEWSKVDFENETLQVFDRKINEWVLIPISTKLLEVLKHHRQRTDFQAKYVFETERGNPISCNTANMILKFTESKEVQELLNCEHKITSNMMRHSFATKLAKRGISDEVVIKCMSQRGNSGRLSYKEYLPKSVVAHKEVFELI